MSGMKRKRDNDSSSKKPQHRPSKSKKQAAAGAEKGKLYDIEKILARSLVRATGKNEYLVKWSDYPDSENSWEPAYGLEERNAHWLVDYNRAEDGLLKIKELQEFLTTLLSVSKAPPGTFAGVDLRGLGVVVPPRLKPATTNGKAMTMKLKEEPEEEVTGHEDNAEEDQYDEFVTSVDYPAMGQVEPVGARGPAVASGSQNLEMEQAHPNSLISAGADNNQDRGKRRKPLVLGAPSNSIGNDRAVRSTVYQPNIFHTKGKLFREYKLLQAERDEKDQRIKELEAELKTVKGRDNKLQEVTKERDQAKKDLEAQSLLERQRKENENEVQSNETVDDTIGTLTTERDQLPEMLKSKDVTKEMEDGSEAPKANLQLKNEFVLKESRLEKTTRLYHSAMTMCRKMRDAHKKDGQGSSGIDPGSLSSIVSSDSDSDDDDESSDESSDELSE